MRETNGDGGRRIQAAILTHNFLTMLCYLQSFTSSLPDERNSIERGTTRWPRLPLPVTTLGLQDSRMQTDHWPLLDWLHFTWASTYIISTPPAHFRSTTWLLLLILRLFIQVHPAITLFTQLAQGTICNISNHSGQSGPGSNDNTLFTEGVWVNWLQSFLGSNVVPWF